MIHHINKGKDKDNVIFSIDAESVYAIVQYLFMRETLNKVGIEEAYLNIIKFVPKKLTANIMLNVEKLTTHH